jgi:hypothetical protein
MCVGCVMARKMMTKRVFINQPGTLSDRLETKTKVHFDLIETQDFADGVPDLQFSFGNLRFGDEATPSVLSAVHLRTPLVLAGGGISTTILLSGSNAFTVMGVIQETPVYTANIAA